MKLALNPNTRQWFAQYTQCGSPTGWSAWEPLDRQQALNFIELGWSFEQIS